MLNIGSSCAHRALCGLLGLAGVLTSGLAMAQVTPVPEPVTPAPPPSPAAPSADPEPKIELTKKKPMMDLATPVPAAPEGRTYHTHDGFQLRINVGLGALLSGSSATEGFADVRTGGLTFAYDVLIGGAPSPGLVIGGAVVGSLQLSGQWEVEDGPELGGGNLNTIVIGPFIEGYPDANGGWHFGGSVGFARLGTDSATSDENPAALGVGGAFWAGTGVWVAPDWSIGGLLRLDAAWGKDSGTETTLSSVGLSLMFSVDYN